MAELSLETQSIIARLKREGELLRNDGAHSIKSVKIELAKFSGLFETISSSIDSQTDTLRAAAGFSEDAALAQQRQNEILEAAGISEQERNELTRRQFQNQQLAADEDRKDQEERAAARDKKEKGFFSKLGGFFSKETFGKIMSGVKFGILGAVGLTLGYDFISGLLKGMGVDVEGFEKGFKDGFNNFVTFLKDVDWKGVGDTLKMFATPEALLAATGLSLLPTAVGAISDAALTTALLNSLRGNNAASTANPADFVGPSRPDDPNTNRDNRNRPGRGGRFNIRNILTGLPKNPIGLLVSGLGLSAMFFAEEIGEFFVDEGKNATKGDITSTPVDTSMAPELATIGSFTAAGAWFGIKGMLVGALVGSAYVLGKKVVESLDDAINDTGDLPNDLEKVLKIERNPQAMRRAKMNAQRTGERIKTFEEQAVETVEQINNEIEQSTNTLEELKNKSFDNMAPRNKLAAENSNKIQIQKLEEEILLRQKQLKTVEQTLKQRQEQGVADLDTGTPGYQLTYPEVTSQTNQLKTNLNLENSFDTLGLNMQNLSNALANQSSNVDTQGPYMVVDNSSVSQGGTTINNITNQSSNANATTIYGGGDNPGSVYASGSIS